jgi:hypothetical protein
VSCNTTSIEEFANITPVRPPTVNKKINPRAQTMDRENLKEPPCRVPSQLKILIPVGTAIIIVAEVKYARVSTSIPTVNM